MNTSGNTKKQVLIIFGSHQCSQLTLETTIGIASHLKAEVRGLYVENIDLLHASELPFVREIDLQTAVSQNTDPKKMADRLQYYADSVRELLKIQADTASVKSSFDFARNQEVPSILQKESDAQLIVFPAVQSLWSSRRKKTNLKTKEPFLVFTDDSISSGRAVEIAAALAKRDNTELIVFNSDKSLSNVIAEQLKSSGINYTIKENGQPDSLVLLDLVKQYAPRLLFLPESSELATNQGLLQRLVGKSGCDIVLVR